MMAKNLYVGNLAWSVSADDLMELFGQFGAVARAQVITDHATGQSRGFGFVEMVDAKDALLAIERLHDASYNNRKLVVNEAQPRAQAPRADQPRVE